MRIFVTSGATVAFPALVWAFGESMLDSLSCSGVKEVVIQYGHAEAEFEEGPKTHRLVQGFAFKPSLEEDIARADLVISHAGSGSILDVLRSSPNGRPLIIVVNTDLMDNHQLELANALDGHQALVSSLSDLEQTIAKARTFDFEPLAKPSSIQPVLHQELVNSQIYDPIQ